MQKKPVTSLFLPARQFPGVRNKRVEKYQCSAIYLYTFICVVIYIVAADQRNFIVIPAVIAHWSGVFFQAVFQFKNIKVTHAILQVFG